MRRHCRFEAQQNERASTRLGSATTIAAVERLARSDSRLAIAPDALNSDPWTLNTAGGIVDLRTGTVRPCDPAALCTRMTGVAPAEPGSDAPMWRRFLSTVMGGDAEVIGYLKRAVGYSLTGDASEECFFFAHGTGANGKSVFIRVQAAITETYSQSAAPDLLLATDGTSHPTELADIEGARLVYTSEIDGGRRWNEARLKQLTGRDTVKARRMRCAFTEFRPICKLWIAGNRRPRFRGVDEAWRRRVHLLPFLVTVQESERDPQLAERLIAEEEGPAILRWAIDGALEWRRNRLSPPAAVREATAEYLIEGDAIGRWLEECCIRDRERWEDRTKLFESWRSFCDNAGEQARHRGEPVRGAVSATRLEPDGPARRSQVFRHRVKGSNTSEHNY